MKASDPTPEIQRAVAAEREALRRLLRFFVLHEHSLPRDSAPRAVLEELSVTEQEVRRWYVHVRELVNVAPGNTTDARPSAPADALATLERETADVLAALRQRAPEASAGETQEVVAPCHAVKPNECARVDLLDRLAEVRALLAPLWPLEKWTVWKRGYGVAVLLDATGAAPNEEEWGEIETAINALPALRRLVEGE